MFAKGSKSSGGSGTFSLEYGKIPRPTPTTTGPDYGPLFQQNKTGRPATPATFATRANGDGAMTYRLRLPPVAQAARRWTAIFRDGNALIYDACPAELLPELEALCLPRISEAEGKAVAALLKEHAGRVRYVVERGGSNRRRRRAHAGRGARLRRRNRSAPTLPLAGSDRLHQSGHAAQSAADDRLSGTGSGSV